MNTTIKVKIESRQEYGYKRAGARNYGPMKVWFISFDDQTQHEQIAEQAIESDDPEMIRIFSDFYKKKDAAAVAKQFDLKVI